MNRSTGWIAAVGIAVSFPLTVAFMHLVASYWAYWDLGINPGANQGVLLFLYAPAMWLALATVALVASFVLGRRMRKAAALPLALAAQLTVVAGSFVAIAAQDDESRWGEETVRSFLSSYVKRVTSGDLHPERRRPQ